MTTTTAHTTTIDSDGLNLLLRLDTVAAEPDPATRATQAAAAVAAAAERRDAALYLRDTAALELLDAGVRPSEVARLIRVHRSLIGPYFAKVRARRETPPA